MKIIKNLNDVEIDIDAIEIADIINTNAKNVSYLYDFSRLISDEALSYLTSYYLGRLYNTDKSAYKSFFESIKKPLDKEENGTSEESNTFKRYEDIKLGDTIIVNPFDYIKSLYYDENTDNYFKDVSNKKEQYTVTKIDEEYHYIKLTNVDNPKRGLIIPRTEYNKELGKSIFIQNSGDSNTEKNDNTNSIKNNDISEKNESRKTAFDNIDTYDFISIDTKELMKYEQYFKDFRLKYKDYTLNNYEDSNDENDKGRYRDYFVSERKRDYITIVPCDTVKMLHCKDKSDEINISSEDFNFGFDEKFIKKYDFDIKSLLKSDSKTIINILDDIIYDMNDYFSDDGLLAQCGKCSVDDVFIESCTTLTNIYSYVNKRELSNELIRLRAKYFIMQWIYRVHCVYNNLYEPDYKDAVKRITSFVSNVRDRIKDIKVIDDDFTTKNDNRDNNTTNNNSDNTNDNNKVNEKSDNIKSFDSIVIGETYDVKDSDNSFSEYMVIKKDDNGVTLRRKTDKSISTVYLSKDSFNYKCGKSIILSKQNKIIIPSSFDNIEYGDVFRFYKDIFDKYAFKSNYIDDTNPQKQEFIDFTVRYIDNEEKSNNFSYMKLTPTTNIESGKNEDQYIAIAKWLFDKEYKKLIIFVEHKPTYHDYIKNALMKVEKYIRTETFDFESYIARCEAVSQLKSVINMLFNDINSKCESLINYDSMILTYKIRDDILEALDFMLDKVYNKNYHDFQKNMLKEIADIKKKYNIYVNDKIDE